MRIKTLDSWWRESSYPGFQSILFPSRDLARIYTVFNLFNTCKILLILLVAETSVERTTHDMIDDDDNYQKDKRIIGEYSIILSCVDSSATLGGRWSCHVSSVMNDNDYIWWWWIKHLMNDSNGNDTDSLVTIWIRWW